MGLTFEIIFIIIATLVLITEFVATIINIKWLRAGVQNDQIETLRMDYDDIKRKAQEALERKVRETVEELLSMHEEDEK